MFEEDYYIESAAGIDPLRGEWFRRNSVIVNWVMNSLVSAMAMVLLLRVVLSAGLCLGPAVLGVLAIGLGAVYYPYATTYYAHNPAANLLSPRRSSHSSSNRRRGETLWSELSRGPQSSATMRLSSQC